MSKTLISWYAYNHDFMQQHANGKTQRLEEVNENGPTFDAHRYFGKYYSKHILLCDSDKKENKVYFNLLVGALKKYFGKRTEIIPRTLPVKDIIDIEELYKEVNKLLLEFKNEDVEVFVSPGTPQMQIAWHFAQPNYKRNVELFQIRQTKHTVDRKEPERFYSKIETFFDASVFSIANQQSSKQPQENKILVVPTLQPFYDKANQLAKTNNVSCLILGESGTGKENLAFHIHKESARHKPTDKNFTKFKAINCASFSDDLLRSELFGHEKGSFTGAIEKKIGLFEEANGGTIFLDEIGDISEKMQVSLLRVLQEKKIQHVGGTKEIPVDVRIVAATNQPLEVLCERKEFRWDLYFRLAVATIELPPLRDWTKKEIKDLIEHFNSIYFTEFNHHKSKLIFSKEVTDFLTNYHFKGNVRELQNLILSLYTFSSGKVELSDLPPRMFKKNVSLGSKEGNEKELIKGVLEKTKWNISHAAKKLGITRSTLRNKIVKYNLKATN